MMIFRNGTKKLFVQSVVEICEKNTNSPHPSGCEPGWEEEVELSRRRPGSGMLCGTVLADLMGETFTQPWLGPGTSTTTQSGEPAGVLSYRRPRACSRHP